MNTPRLLSTNRVRKWGGSYVVSLVKGVREALGLRDGDTIAFRKVGYHVFVTVVRASSIPPVSEEEIKLGREVLVG